jgi:hypothetical protein
MKTFVFTYFVGRGYTSDDIDTAISCMSVFNKTDEVTSGTYQVPNSTYQVISGINVIRPENFLLVTFLMIIFLGINI